MNNLIEQQNTPNNDDWFTDDAEPWYPAFADGM